MCVKHILSNHQQMQVSKKLAYTLLLVLYVSQSAAQNTTVCEECTFSRLTSLHYWLVWVIGGLSIFAAFILGVMLSEKTKRIFGSIIESARNRYNGTSTNSMATPRYNTGSDGVPLMFVAPQTPKKVIMADIERI